MINNNAPITKKIPVKLSLSVKAEPNRFNSKPIHTN